jgi:hypothetical protein
MDRHENMAMHMIYTHGRRTEETYGSYEELRAEHDGLTCPPVQADPSRCTVPSGASGATIARAW